MDSDSTGAFDEAYTNIKQEPPEDFAIIFSADENEDENEFSGNEPQSEGENKSENAGRKSRKVKRKYKANQHGNNHEKCHPIICIICDEKLECRTMKAKHLADVHNNTYKCNKCPHVARTNGLLFNHKAVHEKRFSCETCKGRFSHNNILRDHQMHKKHGIYATLPEMKFICDICKKAFPSHYRWHAHKFIMHNPKKAHCDLCGKSVINKEYMRRHMFLHLKEPCSICNKLISNLTFKRHILDMHTEKPTVECHICKKSFKSDKHVKGHIKRMHEKLRCKFLCRAKLPNMNQVLEHNKIHVGINQWKCKHCSFSATTFKYLNRHLRSKHKSTQ